MLWVLKLDRKVLEYIIIAIAIILLAYVSYCFITYQYAEEEIKINNTISLLAPSSSTHTVVGDRIEFRNKYYDIYNLNIRKTTSSDEQVKGLLNYYLNFDGGTIDYLNESCYLVTVPIDDNNGFSYHSMIIPNKAFDKNNASFTKNTTVWVFNGKNRDFVLDSAFNSWVIL